MMKIDEIKKYKFSEIIAMLENGELPEGTMLISDYYTEAYPYEVTKFKSWGSCDTVFSKIDESAPCLDIRMLATSWTIKLPEEIENSTPHFRLTIEDRFDDPIIEIDGEVVDLTDVHYMVFDQRMMLVKNPYATKWISEKIKMSMGIVTNENQRNGIFGKIYYMAKNILPWNLDCYREQRQAVDDALKESKEKYLEEKNKK